MILLTTFQVWESHTRSLIPGSSWKMGIFLAAGHPDSQTKRSDIHTSLTPQSWSCTPNKALWERRKAVFPEHPTVCQGPYQQLCLHIAFNPQHELLIALLCQWGNRGSGICDELPKLTVLAEGAAGTSPQDPCHFSLFGLSFHPQPCTGSMETPWLWLVDGLIDGFEHVMSMLVVLILLLQTPGVGGCGVRVGVRESMCAPRILGIKLSYLHIRWLWF